MTRCLRVSRQRTDETTPWATRVHNWASLASGFGFGLRHLKADLVLLIRTLALGLRAFHGDGVLLAFHHVLVGHDEVALLGLLHLHTVHLGLLLAVLLVLLDLMLV